MVHNFKDEEKTKKPNTTFPGSISCCSFYYVDKFLLLSSKNSLYLYKYYIETEEVKQKEKNDLRKYEVSNTPSQIFRLLNNNRYKLAASVTQEAQGINHFACANSFLSRKK